MSPDKTGARLSHIAGSRLARAKGVEPIGSLDDLWRFALDVWDSDEDLEAFLADVRASRHANHA